MGSTAFVGVRGIYEVAIEVLSIERSEAFYASVLGMEVGARDPVRNWVFLRIGDAGMVVLQQVPPEQWRRQHVAFEVADEELDAATLSLRGLDLTVRGPKYHAWMPARSLYFDDPDGHELELCAPVRGAEFSPVMRPR